ncbi:hypothetical protein MJI12_27130, partial [Salmonella enterica subsp. enterica serovar Kentucky]|nr:hypothetical protein [Salmonella enterica subsp. enterica serovar Kentucky]
LCEELAQENISARTFDKLVYQNLTLYLDALMNKESPRARQDKEPPADNSSSRLPCRRQN